VVAHGPLPIPRLSYLRPDGAESELFVTATPPGQATLLVLWATWCQPCLAELQQLDAEQASLRAAGLDLIALNLDEPDADAKTRTEAWRAAVDRLKLTLPGGLATQATIEALDIVQRVIVSRQEPLPLPCSLLLDDKRQLLAIYKGPIQLDQLRKDVAELAAKSDRPWRDRAVPLAGRWYINVVPPHFTAIPEKLLQLGQGAAAYEYLKQNLGVPGSPIAAQRVDWYRLFQASLADLYFRAGLDFAEKKQSSQAVEAFRAALACAPEHWETHAALASLLSALRQDAAALQLYQKMLELRPDDLQAANNVAWILATASEPSVRNPRGAVELAERVCRATQYRVPVTLDTLAASYAAAGRYADAVRTAEKALEILGKDNRSAPALALRKRLEAYRQGKAASAP
jgi:tetratricopeptide (TPR) repeat protein